MVIKTVTFFIELVVFLLRRLGKIGKVYLLTRQ